MKKIYLLMFLLVSGFSFAQGTDYVIKISNLSYSINAGVKNRTSSNIRITVRYKDGTSSNAYTRDIRNNGDREVNLDIAAFNRNSKPVSVECYVFVNFRSGTDANSTISKNIDTFCPSGSFSGSYSPRMSNVTFNYKIEPKFYVNRVGDDILPTHTKKTIIATPGYDTHYYRWQYTLVPNATATQWEDLPLYNTKPSITVDAVDILGENTGLNIGKYIYFRIKPCSETPGLSTLITYTIRLSAPEVVSFTQNQPKCTDTDDGSVQLFFNRTLLKNEQLNYTLIDAGTGTPAGYNGILGIGADKTFNIPNLRAGTYILQLIGFKDGLNTAVNEDLFALTTFTIKSPPPLDFTLTETNVQCNGSQDGSILISPTGGTRVAGGKDYYSLDNGVNWNPFPNDAPYLLAGLAPGTYKIKVKDMNGCIAREQSLLDGKIVLEEEIVREKKISQPVSPLSLSYTLKKDPTFKGAANGKIVAAISGGTIKDDKTYNFEWRNIAGDLLPATGQYNSADKTYNITLDNVPDGEYKLTVKDKNYNTAIDKAGCSVIESSETLTEPGKIVITITETHPISCNSENSDSEAEKFSDGVFTATVVGGIKFTGSANNGLPYKYTWSKYNTVTNLWEELTGEKTASIEGISQGNYSLNVEDANGIVQGDYSTTDLITAIPTTKSIIEPTKLELSFNSGNVSCFEGNNGWTEAIVTGGTGSYKFTWYNTGGGIIDKNKVSQLTKGEYFVEVTDGNDCFIKGSVVIGEPTSQVAIEYYEIFTPTFFGATNGRIIAKITGGTPNDNEPLYNYEWKNAVGTLQTTTAAVENGIYTITLNGVPADDYFLTVKDKNYNEGTNQIVNCSVIESKVRLNEPDPLKVVFEIIRDISCNTSNEFGNNTDTAPQDGQRDESQDGILMAHVTGGTPLATSSNNGLPYYFYWKKQETDGSWTALPNIKGETATNLSHGNYALNIKDRNGIMLGTYVNNQLTQEIDVTQLMQEPPKLSVTITHGDVYCNGGNDGWATANPVGGTPPYDYKWSNGVEDKENVVLKKGDYWVFITDAKGCTTQADVKITEPLSPLSIKYTEILNPSFYKATNGKIVVEITGGTIFLDNTYWFEWKNSKGILQTATTTSFNNGIYTISLNGLDEETYSLTVRDRNYDAATNKISCTVANSVTSLDDPDPLEVTFEIVRTISCNVSNEFGNETDFNPQDGQRDESQDGILTAHVKGGIQLKPNQNNGLLYYYTWKKQQKDGSWILWNDHDETVENISDGTYALNIEDANGIKLGTYVNNVLVKEIDVTQFMPEPAKLNLTFTKLNASCNNGDDGWAEAHVTGGTAPYTYEWTNGDTTAKIENITTNNYFVMITDAKGCTIQGSIFVGDPKGILSTETVKNPTCYTGNNGSIQLNVTGGNLPYTYLWSTGETTKDLNNLAAGNYEVAITCPDCCVYKKRFVLKDPNQIVVDLGKDRTLCNDQVLDLDATIADTNAKYNWTSTTGFTSNDAKVTLSKAGTYTVKVTTALGCISEDEIVIKTSQAIISSEFLLSSQAYLDEEVILVNTSNPFGESTKWVIPDGVKIVEQKEKYITLKFDATGVYAIGLEQTQGECYATFSKNITVEKRSGLPNTGTASQFIVDFIVTPNPSNGNFKALVTLENTSAVNLRLFSTTGQNTMIQKNDSGKKKYEIDFETSLESGMYILVLETGQQTLVKKIIIY
ncbi:T9SS type A sorting domain-containing protein [Flavobacterium sp. MEB061]|uniref:T9SS type A sorting domain-containing protein n=1 Tax=Flavobacterium sp. MEB061 TaxID=1587524 RepID=UPI0009E52A98|nr:T9SS type A sorting domain-containing protein [Flavobacterium sp. MEB061]